MGISQESSQRTVYQLVDKDGKPSVAAHTMPLWVDKTQTDVFSLPTAGNKIESFISGKDYFADLIKVCDAATQEIYIAGWQVNWDAMLSPGVRLYDLLLRCAKRGVKIYVMPWDDHEPIQTYDGQTKIILESINESIKSECVYVALCPSFASTNSAYFSHHQKQVVVDRKIAFVGGMDLCYGRYDDARFELDAGAEGRRIMNRYNPGIPALRTKINKSDLVDPDLMSGAVDTFHVSALGRTFKKSTASGELEKLSKGGWQMPYGKPGTADILADGESFSSDAPAAAELDETRQPRMPWQDIHSKIEGPAVSPLLKNFILRWNAISENKKRKLKRESPAKSYPKTGNSQIQVLRTAPTSHCRKEFENNSGTSLAKGQRDIYIAMKNLIAKSTRFIYIENQFFVSDFGEIGGPSDTLSGAAEYIQKGAGGISNNALRAVRFKAEGKIDELPKNTILKSLLERFKKAILDDISKPKFHVYITLPVNPEGSLTDGAVSTQIYYTMQTLVFGSHSLINGLRRLIKARELKDKKDKFYMRVLDGTNSEFESVSEDACLEYVTLLNLRNWKSLGNSSVTEQIYVHSKLMIVDDRFVLLGSANINDRSLLGERDSEIAVLVMDEDTRRADINGKGSNQPVRLFAHELRIKIWKKLFGITCNVRPASELKDAVAAPGSQHSWKTIQDRAEKNAVIFESIFPFIPRNISFGGTRTASILPTWRNATPQSSGKLSTPLPSQDNFWDSPFISAHASELNNVKGFIVRIPLSWSAGENNRIKYPTPLIVLKDKTTHPDRDDETEVAMSEKDSKSSIQMDNV